MSRRDVAWVLSTGEIGATTVSATSLLAVKAGIHIFATGGIGGVHRDGMLDGSSLFSQVKQVQ